MSFPDEELRSKREFTKELIADSKANLKQGEIPPDRVHLVYNSLGGEYRSLGIYASLLGEESEAREHFTEATDYYLSGTRTARKRRDQIEKGDWESEPNYLLKALYIGPLTSDDRLAEIARTALEMDDEYVTEFPDMRYRYYTAKALAATVLDADEARTHMQLLRDALDGVRPELAEFFGAIGTVVAGILDDDSETVADGVRRLLDDHASTVDGDPTTLTEAVSIPATGLLAIARHCGIDVTVESDYLLPLVETET